MVWTPTPCAIAWWVAAVSIIHCARAQQDQALDASDDNEVGLALSLERRAGGSSGAADLGVNLDKYMSMWQKRVSGGDGGEPLITIPRLRLGKRSQDAPEEAAYAQAGVDKRLIPQPRLGRREDALLRHVVILPPRPGRAGSTWYMPQVRRGGGQRVKTSLPTHRVILPPRLGKRHVR